MFFLLYIIFFSRSFCLSFLTNNQFHFINQQLFTDHGEQYREILFLHSQPFARSVHFKFCQNSKFVQRMTYKQKQDLLYYGYGGLWKAALNYNGKNNFYKYASFYVDGELKRGVSDHLSSCLLPHRYRVNFQYDIDNLVVKEAYCGKKIVMKRFRPRAKGRAAPILKPWSTVTIILSEVKQMESHGTKS